MNFEADVCIVGAGPGGALLAYLLAKKNISVILLERHSSIEKEFRGEHLNNEGEQVLKKHGLFTDIEELGLLRMEKLEYWNNGQLYKTVLPDKHVGHLGIHVPQAHLLSILISKSQLLPSYTIMTDTKVIDLIEDENGQFIGVRAKKSGEEITVHSQLIVGADGRFSTVRKKAEIEVKTKKHGYDLLWAKIPAPDGWEPSIKMALVNGKQISLFTQTKGYIQIGWNIDEGAFPQIRKQPFEPFINQLIDAFPQLKETVKSHIQSWHDFVLLDVHSSKLPKWGKDGVILIGDAAHTMTPTGAFGLNCSLKDADVLAELINNDFIDRLGLLTCATKRKKEVSKLQAIQIEKEQSFASQFVILA